MRLSKIIFIFSIVILLFVFKAYSWRTVLYPTNWYPGYTVVSNGIPHYLQDFSYAGYKKGETNVPYITGPIYNVVNDYGADNTGGSDATSAIQNAINAAGSGGGGVVYFPAGTYRVSLQAGKKYAIGITYNNVILRGDGTNSKIFCTNTTSMDGYNSVVLISPDGNYGWSYWGITTEINPQNITVDVYRPTNIITVADASGFSIGDWVVIKDDCNNNFIADHYMTGKWDTSLRGVMFYRVITDINGNNIKIDIPVRYKLLSSYNARVYKISVSHLEEIGIENIAFGMKESPGSHSTDVETSYLISFRHIVNSWMNKVYTYCNTSENPQGFHIRSNGVELYQCRNITISSCVIQKSQYQGTSGSGYIYILSGNDNLIKDSKAISGRHNYSFKKMASSGNVIYRCYTEGGVYPADYHMYLSMANLIDNMQVKNDYLQAKYRPYSTPEHGHTTTQSVFWNIESLGSTYSYLVQTEQFSNGYVIGTSGSTPTGVDRLDDPTENYTGTHPIDWVEGVGTGNTLEPTSLYEDQLLRRLGNINGVTNYDVYIVKSNTGVYYSGNSKSGNPLPGYTLEYFVKSSNKKTNINTYRVFNRLEGNWSSNSLIVSGLQKQYSTKTNPSYYYNSSDWQETEPAISEVKYIGGKTNDFQNGEVLTYTYRTVLGLVPAGNTISNNVYGIVNDYINSPFYATVENITVGTMYGGRFSYISDITQEGYSGSPLYVDVSFTNKGNISSKFILKVTNVDFSTSSSDWYSEIIDSNLTVITQTPLLAMNEVFNFRIKFTHSISISNNDWVEFRVTARVPGNTISTSYIGDDGKEYGGDIGKSYNGVNGINPGIIFQQNNTNIRLTYRKSYPPEDFLIYIEDGIGHYSSLLNTTFSYLANYGLKLYIDITNNNIVCTQMYIVPVDSSIDNSPLYGERELDNKWIFDISKRYQTYFDTLLKASEDVTFQFRLFFNNNIVSNWISGDSYWEFNLKKVKKQNNGVTILDNLIDDSNNEIKVVCDFSGSKDINIAVYNITGTKVKQVVNTVLEGGTIVKWDGRDESGNKVPTGIYLCVVKIGEITELRTIIVKNK